MKGLLSRYIGVVIAVAGLLMFIFGVISGETDEVLRKAATICLECIGLR
ncbi:MAG: thioredoxin [Clostridia bacterium]|nr:thioredoxin [Clostridia bacterium]